MDDRVERRVLWAVLGAALLLPLVIIVTHPHYGLYALLVGLVIATACGSLLRSLHAEGAIADQQALLSRQDRGRTIYVELLDENGRGLPPEEAEKRLAEARLRAGPRDTVMGIRHRRS
jgi:hypothetical protein